MSIYYELRMKGKLSFKDKTDELSLKVKDFFKRGMSVDEKLRGRGDIILELESDFILKHDTLENKYFNTIIMDNIKYTFTFNNNFLYDNEILLVKISELETDVFDVDFCIGNKNNYSELEVFTLLLMNYMVEEFNLVYYNESCTRKLIINNSSLDKYIKENTEGDEYSCTIFDTLDVIAITHVDDDIEYGEQWLREDLEI